MKVLQSSNECIQSHLRKLFQTAPADRTPVGMQIKDFDDTTFSLVLSKKNLSVFFVSIKLGCFRELEEMGVRDKLASIYRDMMVDPAPGYDVTLAVNLDSPDAPPEEVVAIVSNLKGVLMSYPIEAAWQLTLAGGSDKLFRLAYRDGEPMWLAPRDKKLTIVISVKLVDEDDEIIGRSFLQELNDFRDPSVNNPPGAGFSETEDRKPRLPVELGDFGVNRIPPGTNYVVLNFDQSHFRTDAISRNTCMLIQNFRNFVHYHIKCCKANLHIRQRQSVVSLLQQLNRAQEESK